MGNERTARKRLCKRLRENTENPLVCGAAADMIEVQHILLGDKDKEIERLQALLDEPETEEIPDGLGHIKAKEALDRIER